MLEFLALNSQEANPLGHFSAHNESSCSDFNAVTVFIDNAPNRKKNVAFLSMTAVKRRIR